MTKQIVSECKSCGKEFKYKYARGCARLYCKPSCKEKPKVTKVCNISNCDTLARTNGSDYCEKHYYRIRRNGTLFIDKTRKKTKTSHGYISVRLEDVHPLFLATGQKNTYEHRAIFFEKYGFGPYQCNWCKKGVSWKQLHVDHINEKKDDNRIDNLVASCAYCNQNRNAEKKKKASQKANGIFYTRGSETYCLSQWSRRLGIASQTFVKRVNNGTLKGFNKVLI